MRKRRKGTGEPGRPQRKRGKAGAPGTGSIRKSGKSGVRPCRSDDLSVTLEFIPEGDGTRLEFRQGPFPEEMREMSEIGWSQSLHKLDALLDTPVKFQSAQI